MKEPCTNLDDLMAPDTPTTPDSSFESVFGIDEKSSSFPDETNRTQRHTLPIGWRKFRDGTGRSFYYNEETAESRWKPPRISVSDDISGFSDTDFTGDSFECEDGLYKHSEELVEIGLADQIKERMQQDSGNLSVLPQITSEEVGSSLPTPSSIDKNLLLPSKEGLLHRQKCREGGKLIKKPIWQHMYCSLIGSSLVYYKDANKAAPKSSRPCGKPDSSLDLHGAILDHVPKE